MNEQLEKVTSQVQAWLRRWKVGGGGGHGLSADGNENGGGPARRWWSWVEVRIWVWVMSCVEIESGVWIQVFFVFPISQPPFLKLKGKFFF